MRPVVTQNATGKATQGMLALDMTGIDPATAKAILAILTAVHVVEGKVDMLLDRMRLTA